MTQWVGFWSANPRNGEGSRWAFRASSVEAVGWRMTDMGPGGTVSFKNTEDMRLAGDEAVEFLENSIKSEMPILYRALMGPKCEGDE